MSENLREIEPEYVYITIPAEYVCVYHRILAMLADYGEDMLKDCKASCTDRNSGVIECFNMFNAAIAARRLSKGETTSKYWKLAETLIMYIKAKINQIYKGTDNSTDYVFPVDEEGKLKAFVSCGERPRFYVNLEDGNLYAQHLDNGFAQTFALGPEDESPTGDDDDSSGSDVPVDSEFYADFIPTYKEINGRIVPSGHLILIKDGIEIDEKDCTIIKYFDGEEVSAFENVTTVTQGTHKFDLIVIYNDDVKIINKYLTYEITVG